MTSDPTLPHLILKLALKSIIITSTKNMVCKKVNLVHRRPYERTDLSTKISTKQVGPCTIIQVSFSMGQPVFEKKHILKHPYQCWLYTNCHKNPRNHKNSTFKSKHGTTKWNESTPGHYMPLHHVIVSHCIHASFRAFEQHL